MRKNPWPWIGLGLFAVVGMLLAVILLGLRSADVPGSVAAATEPAPSATPAFIPCDGDVFVRAGTPCPTPAVVAAQPESEPQDQAADVVQPVAPTMAPTPPAVPTPDPALVAVQTPASVAPTLASVPPTAMPAPTVAACRPIADFELPGRAAVAVGPGEYLHVDFGAAPDGPGLNGILEAGQYDVVGVAFGHAWHFPAACSRETVEAEMRGHIHRRQAQGFPTLETDTATLAQHFVRQLEAPSGAAQAVVEEMGLNAYPPAPAGPGEVYVAHGDLDQSGTCRLAMFDTGAPVADLGAGTWRMVRVRGGSHESRLNRVEEIRAGAARHAGTPCPNLF